MYINTIAIYKMASISKSSMCPLKNPFAINAAINVTEMEPIIKRIWSALESVCCLTISLSIYCFVLN